MLTQAEIDPNYAPTLNEPEPKGTLKKLKTEPSEPSPLKDSDKLGNTGGTGVGPFGKLNL